MKQKSLHKKLPESVSPTKRDQILNTAKELFLEHGFASTSVDTITATSGVSKPTVYSYFPTKEALLEAVVLAESKRLDTPPAFEPTGNPRKDLEQVAVALSQMALDPHTLAWDRMMAGEARRKPDLGRLFFDCGPGRAVDILALFFEKLSGHGGIRIPDPTQAAEFFFGMVVGLPLLRAQLTGKPNTNDSALTRCREIADRFLRAYSTSSKSNKR